MEPFWFDCRLPLEDHLGKKRWLTTSHLAHRLAADGAYECERSRPAFLEDDLRRCWETKDWASELRAFVVQARVYEGACLPDWLPRDELVRAIAMDAESERLVVVREVGQGRGDARVSARLRAARITREIDRLTGGRLDCAGRRYRLVVRERVDRNELGLTRRVVSPTEAVDVVGRMAVQYAANRQLGVLLDEARQLIAAAADRGRGAELLLLRHLHPPHAKAAFGAPAMTPSQLRKEMLTWIGIDVVDNLDQPWAGTVNLTLPDGDERPVEIRDGSLTMEGIRPGSVSVCLPAIDARIHTVAQGECLSSIAHVYGFPTYRPIYDDPANKEFRTKRPNPNLIYPGDEIHIPARKDPPRVLATGQRHRIVITRPVAKLRLLVSDGKKSAAGCRYRLKVGNLDEQKTVPANGIIETVVPADAKEGTLWIFWEAGEYQPLPIRLAIGHLDPPELPTGYQARLSNLGYRRGPFSGKPGRRTRLALSAFQRAEGLAVTGKADAETCARLAKHHDEEA